LTKAPFPNIKFSQMIQISSKEDKSMATPKKPMTKAQTVAYFAEKFELTKNTANAILDELAGLAVSETKKTGSFTLNGIGKLVLSKRKARTGRNPQTGEPIKIPAKTVIKMRMAKAFKDAVVPPKKK
jgi:DNA-binding protein HU-beta